MITNSGDRVAVVVVHGMGNQFPMDTLRGLVDGLKPDDAQLYSSPNRITSDKETRRLSFSTGPYDFYEYYWAHYVEEPPLADVLKWSFKLLFCKKPSERLRPNIWFVRGAVIGLLLIIAALIFMYYKWWSPKFKGLLDITVWSTILIAGFGVIKQLLTTGAVKAVTGSIGDVIKYTVPSPENIKTRDQVRKNGIELLENLHTATNDSKDKWKYSKVVVVAHSLGSVVAYDMLTSLFALYHKRFSDIPEKTIEQHALQAVKDRFYKTPPAKCQQSAATAAMPITSVTAFAAATPASAADSKPTPAFQELQNALYHEYRKLGHEWRVSDFITLGSPLTHADMILTRGQEDFNYKKELREFPTCPPQYDCKDHHFAFAYTQKNKANQEVSITTLHHAAHFASTQWTNIFFEKDWIGGPLAPGLGQGILDIEINPTNWWMKNIPLSAHTRYWDKTDAHSLEKLKKVFAHVAPFTRVEKKKTL